MTPCSTQKRGGDIDPEGKKNTGRCLVGEKKVWIYCGERDPGRESPSMRRKKPGIGYEKKGVKRKTKKKREGGGE